MPMDPPLITDILPSHQQYPSLHWKVHVLPPTTLVHSVIDAACPTCQAYSCFHAFSDSVSFS